MPSVSHTLPLQGASSFLILYAASDSRVCILLFGMFRWTYFFAIATDWASRVCVLKFELCEKGVWFSLCSMLLFGNMGVLIGQNSTLQRPPFFERKFHNRQHAHPCVLQVHCAKIYSFLQCVFAVFVWVSFALMRCSKNFQNDDWTQSRLANKKTKQKHPGKYNGNDIGLQIFPAGPYICVYMY